MAQGSRPNEPASDTFESVSDQFSNQMMSDKPEGDLRSVWILPVSLLLYMAVLAAIGYLVFFR